MTSLPQTSHRVAAVLSVGFLLLAVVFGNRYRQAHGGWDLASGSNDLMTLMLLALGVVLTGSFALLRPGRRNWRTGTLTSIIWSLAILGCLLFSWHVIDVAHRWDEPVGTPITSPDEMAAFIAQHPASFSADDYEVPTGVFLQSFEFLNANNVEMAGYIWQTYSPDVPDTIRRGIVLPEAVEEAYEAHEAWRFEDDEGEHISWYFNGVFRQNFDYRYFPFDHQDIWLRIWHIDPQRPVLLVPDFASYSNLTPATLPGMEREFVYGGWDPVGSEFSYDLITYNTNFGRGGELNGIPYPDLFFNLSVKRDFLGPLLEHLVLETAIAILLFLLLVLMAHDTDRQDRVGLTIFDLTVAAGGLLFAVILDHNAIRGPIESQDLVYLEWFPLLLDVVIVLVVLSAVLRVKQWRLPIVGYSGELVPVLAYWPALLGALLTVTLFVFFY